LGVGIIVVSSYRFCRTDDIGLLVDALNRCWRPHFPDEEPVTPATFKRSIRDLQVWCSSCMVAFSGSDPIAVLIGAKRPGGTLIQKIAVHPDHLRQGHGRHMLASIGSKLAILGPPRMAAEVPDTLTAARELFAACGYVEEAVLTDYAIDLDHYSVRDLPGAVASAARLDDRRNFLVPLTVDDLAANGLLEAHPQACWERSAETLSARKDELTGLAVASDEQIEACILYLKDGEILALRSFADDHGVRLRKLLSQLRAAGLRSVRLPKVHPNEIPMEWPITLGFTPVGTHRVYAATARPD
jgi:GNAT superfamily N-acetyltransferase